MSDKTTHLSERERRKQRYWQDELAHVLNCARAVAKYRGQDPNRIFELKMELANAVAEYDSKPNTV